MIVRGLSHHQGNYFPRTNGWHGCEDRKPGVGHTFPAKGAGGNQKRDAHSGTTLAMRPWES